MSSVQKPRLRLYHYWRSSSSWRVRWALKELEFDCEYVAVDLLKNETMSESYRLKNPYQTVPTLEWLDQNRFLSESMAIIRWLDYGRARLFPKDQWAEAKVIQLCELINAGIQPLQNLRVLQAVSSEKAEQQVWVRQWIKLGLKAFEDLVYGQGSGFSFGGDLTAADLFLIPQLYNARRFEVDLNEYPTLLKIEQNCLKRSACAESAPAVFEPTPSA